VFDSDAFRDVAYSDMSIFSPLILQLSYLQRRQQELRRH
jgi:hypothetical protein